MNDRFCNSLFIDRNKPDLGIVILAQMQDVVFSFKEGTLLQLCDLQSSWSRSWVRIQSIKQKKVSLYSRTCLAMASLNDLDCYYICLNANNSTKLIPLMSNNPIALNSVTTLELIQKDSWMVVRSLKLER